MTAAHWIAIAAIITPLITSWAQYILKERSEKRRTLTAATPATPQPKPVKSGEFALYFRRHWRVLIVQFMVSVVCTNYLLTQLTSSAPVTRPSVVLISLATTLWLVASATPFLLNLR